jgi:hypothetical protein
MSKLVLVETISQHRIRYVVDVGDAGDPEWALDTVTMDEATEVSQLHLGEMSVSHRVIDDGEFLRVFDEDNDYLRGIEPERKRGFITVLDPDECGPDVIVPQGDAA